MQRRSHNTRFAPVVKRTAAYMASAVSTEDAQEGSGDAGVEHLSVLSLDAVSPVTLAIPPISTEGPLCSWFTLQNALFALNASHSNIRGVFFDDFRALLEEQDDAVYVRRMADYLRHIQSQYMFVRVERPIGSLRFVLAYLKCERVFSFAPRYEQMQLRLNRVPPMVLAEVEVEENQALRLACIGRTDYEWALAIHNNTRVGENDALLPLLSAAIYASSEKSAVALLNAGADPNEVNRNGYNALHWAAAKGCRPHFFRRLLDRIDDVNAANRYGVTALMCAAEGDQLDILKIILGAPGIDVNVQDNSQDTVLHWAVKNNHPNIVAALLEDGRVDLSIKGYDNKTPLGLAMAETENTDPEIEQILRQHGAPEE